MGQKNSTLNPEQISDLRGQTQFSTAELVEFHKEFLRANPKGRITKQDMKIQYLQLFPEGDPDAFTDQLFQAFDVNEDGTIDFQEFICGIGLITHGSMGQKLDAAFRLCDLDNDGFIFRWELEKIITAIYSAVNQPHDEKNLNAISTADAIFKIMDRNKDDKISLQEFIEGASRTELILLLESLAN